MKFGTINAKLQIYTHSAWHFQNPSKHNYTKCGIIHSLINFLFGTTSSAEEITAIKNSMEILKGNQDVLSNQIKQTFNFVKLTYVETDTNVKEQNVQ